jgi:hypothetical protein
MARKAKIQWITVHVLAGLMFMGMPASAWAQTVSVVQDLSFGTFAAGGGGTVTVTPSGGRTSGGGVILFGGGGFNDGGSANVVVTGTTGSNFSITLPASASLINSGGGSMAISGFSSAPFGSGGSQIAIGATLNVPSQAAPGNYTGSFDIIASYE